MVSAENMTLIIGGVILVAIGLILGYIKVKYLTPQQDQFGNLAPHAKPKLPAFVERAKAYLSRK